MNNFFKKYNLILLISILTLAFFLRIYKITEVPPSLNWDETSIGYNAYSILKTGKDEWGEFLPLHFRSFGEYKLPLQIYASIPAITVFGLNDFSVRITPVIYGTLTVLFLYLLVNELYKLRFKDEYNYISFISSFFLAISPWHIQLTRGSFESSFSLFWLLLGILLLVRGFLKNPKMIILSMIPFAISVYTYNSARVFTPLFLFTVFLLNIKYILKNFKVSVFATLFFIVMMLPLVSFVVSGEALARYKLVSITDDAGLVPRIEERRNLSKLPTIITRLIHNRYTYNSYYFVENYIAHFTPNYLFLKGAGHHQHHVQGVGQLYWIQAPFLLYGLYILFKKKDFSLKILLPWLLISFIPVSMTNDSIPNALRTLIAVPVYQILTAVGVVEALKYRKYTKAIIVSIVLILGINFCIYLTNLYTLYPIRYSRDWQYGNKQVVEYIKENYDNYDLIVFSRTYGEPHIFTLFYLIYDPSKFQNINNLERFETHDWVRVLRFDKFYFPDLGDEGTKYEDILKENKDKRILFIGKQNDFPDNVKRLKTIDFLNGERAFDIVED
jgi:4-amino-4-deoxy-L-arabinose transferase-like glycosyltransferase